MAFAATMCTLVHLRMLMCVYDRDVQHEQMHDEDDVHEHVEFVSLKTKTPISYD